MKYFKIISVLTLLFCLFSFFSLSSSAQELSLSLSPHKAALTDGKENTSATVTSPLTLSSERAVSSLYLLFYDTPTDFLLSDGEREVSVEGKYLRQFVDVSRLLGEGKESLTLTFSANVRILEIYAFEGEVPSWVQIWQEPCERADLCLMTTHADDEQLFFAGVLPFYAGEKDLAVQVIYFTDHKNEPLRRHELLRGLWTVGVENYPVISPFPDLYSTSSSQAQEQFSARGYSRDAVLSFQVEMLRFFRPLVVVGHDPNGEYGHGQHMLNSSTLQEAVRLSGSEEAFPESAARYGVWEVPKTYLHLYPENEMVMDWDVPLDFFGGKTAFQATQAGFLCHDSQQYTWFRTWLNGKKGEITKASQIATYSPCRYGLFHSTVGQDVEKNDFFEHLKTYEERLLEEEARARAEKTDQILSQAGEREEAAAQDAARRLAQHRAEEEERLMKEATVAREKRKVAIVASTAVAGFLAVDFVLLFLFLKRRKRKSRKRR